MKSKTMHAAALVAALTFSAQSAIAQQFVYPAKGQSPQQQKKDEGECHVCPTHDCDRDDARGWCSGCCAWRGCRRSGRRRRGHGCSGGRGRGARAEPTSERRTGKSTTAGIDAAATSGTSRVSKGARRLSRRTRLHGEVTWKRKLRPSLAGLRGRRSPIDCAGTDGYGRAGLFRTRR